MRYDREMVALLFACVAPDRPEGTQPVTTPLETTPPDSTGLPTETPPESWEGVPDVGDAPVLLGPEEVEEAIVAGLVDLLGRDTYQFDANILAAWDRLDERGGCPESMNTSSGEDYTYSDWWSGGCETTSAVRAVGYAARSTNRWSSGTDSGTSISGYFEGTIDTPEGWHNGGFGYYYLEDGRFEDGFSAYHYLIGDLSGESADTAGSWLERTAGTTYSAYIWWDRQDHVSLFLDGNTTLEGEAVAFSVSDMDGYSTDWGYPCPGEYGGRYSVRDANGHWYDLDFDADYEEEVPGTCDGCGDVLVEGTSIGLACPDLEPLLDRNAVAW